MWPAARAAALAWRRKLSCRLVVMQAPVREMKKGEAGGFALGVFDSLFLLFQIAWGDLAGFCAERKLKC
jgi:hypothetical protein